MGKQKQLLKEIIELFYKIGLVRDYKKRNEYRVKIYTLFNLSDNKRDLTRRILNGVVISQDDIVELLKYCYFKNI